MKRDMLEEYYLGDIIGTSTDPQKAIAMANFWKCLLDENHRMPSGKYSKFTLLQDIGWRSRIYSNPSGGNFSGRYRCFSIDNGGCAETVSVSVSAYYTTPDVKKTAINVAIDNGKTDHISLQLVVDDNMDVIGNVCRFYHHGRITVGTVRGARVEELRRLVEEQNPQLLQGTRFYLGELTNDRLWYMDDPQVIHLLENLISYSLLRDAYRIIVRERAQM